MRRALSPYTAIAVLVATGCSPEPATTGSGGAADAVSEPPTDAGWAEAELDEASDDASDDASDGSEPGLDSSDVYDVARPCDESSLDSDPVNCGRCGHDCLGGGCVAGQCQPVVLMERQPFVPGFSGRWLAADGSSLYWWILTEGEQLLMMDVRRRTLTKFTSIMWRGQGVLVVGQQPYWISFGEGVITFDPANDAEINVISGARCTNFAVGPTGACVACQNTPDTSVVRCRRFGEPFVDILKNIGASHFEMDADNVYWLHDNEKMLMRTSLDGGIAMPIASFGTAQRFVIDARHAYWNDGGNLHNVSLNGGVVTTLAAVPNGSMAVDETDIYIATADARIVKVPVEGGAPVTLAPAPSAAGLVGDATRLYWASFIHSPPQTADVMMLAK